MSPNHDFPKPLGKQQLDELFPLKRHGPIMDGAFEIGLALGGTVSAGAYSAGVLDYLIEALDAWTKAKLDATRDVPRHEVVVSTIAGASGGAINGAVLVRAAGWDFPHGPSTQNPFYAAWTAGVDLMGLLSAKPEKGVQGLASLFNCSAIDEQAERVIAYSGAPLGRPNGTPPRSYLADPLRLFMSLGNVTGIPYRIPLKGQSRLGHDLVAHSDYMRFALAVEGGAPNFPHDRPDEIALGSRTSTNWDVLRDTALATSAFPLAFRARGLRRSLATAGYRVAVVPGESGPSEVAQLIPNWELLANDDEIDGQTAFLNVDGGTMSNEPLDLVRSALCGLDGRNPREGAKANRAVVMIDPFSDPETLGPKRPPGLIGLVLPFIMSLVFQARFKPADIALAHDPAVYSRFLIAPYGPAAGGAPISGTGAIASGGLGGFLGFVDGSFPKYDYLVGRRNAFEFLKDDFVFPEDNVVFKAKWSTDQKRIHGVDFDQVWHLPMIPLMPELRTDPPKEISADMWPALAELPAGLASAMGKRLDFVFDRMMESARPESWMRRALLSTGAKLAWKALIKDSIRKWAMEVVRNGLRHQGLLPP